MTQGIVSDDNNEDRNIVFIGNFLIGQHTFTVPVGGLDSLASSNSNVLRVSPEVDLVHGQQYMLIFRYQDYAGNAEKTDSRIVIFDSKTISPVLNTPVCGNRVPPIFELSFTLEEIALTNSVVLNMTRVSGYADPDSWSGNLASLFEVKGTHIVSMTNLSMLAATSAYVDSVNPQVDLVNEATYDIRICYQDAASNLEACTSPFGTCNVTFDSATLAPVILSPAEKFHRTC